MAGDKNHGKGDGSEPPKQQTKTFYKKTLLNTTQLAGWMKTGSPKANKHGISWA
jgi:hypothetical protein